MKRHKKVEVQSGRPMSTQYVLRGLPPWFGIPGSEGCGARSTGLFGNSGRGVRLVVSLARDGRPFSNRDLMVTGRYYGLDRVDSVER
jgi:hypothetical protein